MGVLGRIRESLSRTKQQIVDRLDDLVRRADAPERRSRPLDAETTDELEEILITADVGVAASERIVRALRQRPGLAPGLRELVKEAGHELAAEIATDVLIIEDEALIAMDLEHLVEELGHRVIGVARTHSKAVSIAKAHAPGLILADIHLADNSSGLDAVNELLRTFEVPVIFITAYPERFLTGERPEPSFLIAKPYQPASVSAIISQALFFERKARRREQRATA